MNVSFTYLTKYPMTSVKHLPNLTHSVGDLLSTSTATSLKGHIFNFELMEKIIKLGEVPVVVTIDDNHLHSVYLVGSNGHIYKNTNYCLSTLQYINWSEQIQLMHFKTLLDITG